MADSGGRRNWRAALTEIGAELDNIRAAWRWAVSQNNREAIQPAVETLYNFYLIRSRFQEGQALFADTVTRWQQSAPSGQHPSWAGVMAQLFARWGVFSMELHDFAAAEQQFQTSLQLSDRADNRAFVLGKLGWTALNQGQRARAEEYLRESLRISRDIDDQCGIVDAWQGLTKAAFEFGDMVQAVELGRQSLEASRQLARPDWIARALGMLAWPLCCAGAYGEAEAYWQESLAINEAIGDPLGAATAVNFLGWAAWCIGGPKAAEAIPQHEKALTVYRELAHRELTAMCLGDLGLALLDQKNFHQVIRYAREGLTLARAAGLIHQTAYNLYILGAAFCGLGELITGRNYLVEALKTTWETGKMDNLMNVFFFFAQLLLKESEAAPGEEASLQKREQAFALLCVVVDHPPTWQVFRDRASQLKEEQVVLLPEGVITAVTSSIQRREWPRQVQQLFSELIESQQIFLDTNDTNGHEY